MKMNKLLIACSVALYSGATFATVVDEVEPNNSVDTAQYVDSSAGDITINARMGDYDSPTVLDVDYFQFEAREGEVLTFNIDNGYSSSEPLDTVLGVFGPGPDYQLLRQTDIASSMDEGSVSFLDARIDGFVVPTTGVYTVGVSAMPSSFADGGVLNRGRFLGTPVISDYNLVISGFEVVSMPQAETVMEPEAEPAVVMAEPASDGFTVGVEVKPGSREIAALNPRSRGVIPVAILGSSYFDVAEIDTDSLTFGRTGDEQSLRRCARNTADVNGNGYQDLVCHFDNQDASFQTGDMEGLLKGQTTDGQSFEGRAYLKVVPGRR